MSALDGPPRSSTALEEACLLASNAATVGFDWPDVRGVLDKVREELAELEEALAGAPDPGADAAVVHELGDLLLAVANLGRTLRVDPEAVLRAANRRFSDRFRLMEDLAASRGRSLSELDLAALDRLWEEAKARLRGPSQAGGGG